MGFFLSGRAAVAVDGNGKFFGAAPGSKKKETTGSCHRSLEYYFKIFNQNKLAVSQLEEWISHKESAPGSREHEENRIRKEIPLFLALEIRKV